MKHIVLDREIEILKEDYKKACAPWTLDYQYIACRLFELGYKTREKELTQDVNTEEMIIHKNI